MICVIVEVTNRFNFGKFMVAQFDEAEWAYRSRIAMHPEGMPEEIVPKEIAGKPMLLLRHNGWHPSIRWVLDLQTGEGALFMLRGSAHHDLEKHKIWVCPMYEVFLNWLYAHPEHHDDIRTLPPMLELTDEEAMKASAFCGYRRPGPTK